jgi:predicted CoA-binding protein
MADSADKPNSARNSELHAELAGLSESDAITQILKSGKTIAVVGLSSQRMRPSYGVAQYLQSAGYRIIPVNPNETEVLGEKSYVRLQDVSVPVDIVDIFRRSQFVPEIVDAAIQIGARCVWMQEGVVHVGAAELAKRAGIFVVMDKCTLKEHARRARELKRPAKSS